MFTIRIHNTHTYISMMWEYDSSIGKQFSIQLDLFGTRIIATFACIFATGPSACDHIFMFGMRLLCTSTLWMPWSTPLRSQEGNLEALYTLLLAAACAAVSPGLLSCHIHTYMLRQPFTSCATTVIRRIFHPYWSTYSTYLRTSTTILEKICHNHLLLLNVEWCYSWSWCTPWHCLGNQPTPPSR